MTPFELPIASETMTQTSIATSADYADALLVARRGKHLLFLLLLLMLLGQVAVFFVARYTTVIIPGDVGSSATTMPIATAPTRSAVALNYFSSAMTFFGMILPILYA